MPDTALKTKLNVYPVASRKVVETGESLVSSAVSKTKHVLLVMFVLFKCAKTLDECIQHFVELKLISFTEFHCQSRFLVGYVFVYSTTANTCLTAIF